MYALLACLVLFLACCGVGGFLVYQKYFNNPADRPPPEKPKPVDITRELKGAHGKGKEIYQVAKEAFDHDDLETALGKFNEAKEIWQTASDKIAEIRSDPKYSGKEYAAWEDTASQLESDLKVVNDDIFKTEMRISRNKAQKTEAKSPEAPVQKTEPSGEAKTGESKTNMEGREGLDPDQPTPTESELKKMKEAKSAAKTEAKTEAKSEPLQLQE
jgi:hypothetical protein